MAKIVERKGKSYIELQDGVELCDTAGEPVAMTLEEAKDRLFTGDYSSPDAELNAPAPVRPRTRKAPASSRKSGGSK